MQILGTTTNGRTPTFEVDADAQSGVGRAWGAVRDGAIWKMPAYYPFGYWALRDLAPFKDDLVWDGAARAHLASLKESHASWRESEARWRAKEDPLAGVPDSFFPKGFEPFKHQRYGIARIRDWERTWLLWGMGTGKTRTTLDGLRLLREMGKFTRALVIGPPVVLPGWVFETRRATRGEWRAEIWDGTEESLERCSTADVVCVSYTRVRLAATTMIDHPMRGKMPLFTPDVSRLMELDYDTIVADESHNLGNWDSDQTRAAIHLSARAQRRYCLTGTGGDTPTKVYPQLYFLSPGLVPMSHKEFCDRHLLYSPLNKHLVMGYQHLDEVNARVDSVALRMKKKDCLDLPPHLEHVVHFPLGTRQRARYNEAVEIMQVSDTPMLEYAAAMQGTPTARETAAGLLFDLPHSAARVQKLLQLVSGFLINGLDDQICDACPNMEHCVEEGIRPYTKRCLLVQRKPPREVVRDVENPKLELFENLLEKILTDDPTNKVLCWGIFTEELADMESVCRKLGVKNVRLDGKTTKNVAQIQQTFQEDPECRVLVGMTSAGIGINLPAANYAISYSTHASSIKEEQKDERMARPGQLRAMTSYRLLTSPDTPAVDRRMASLLKFKHKVSLTLLDKVACSTCERQEACSLDGTVPFRDKCKYAAAVAKPTAEVKIL